MKSGRRRPRSIAARLSWMNALVSGIALILAYVSFLAYNLVTFRQAAIDNLTSEAQIIGANSVSAITFNAMPPPAPPSPRLETPTISPPPRYIPPPDSCSPSTPQTAMHPKL